MFSLGVLTTAHQNEPGPDYTICWGGSPLGQHNGVNEQPGYNQTGGSCLSEACRESYNIKLGVFTLAGPRTQDVQCMLTSECTFGLSGFQLPRYSNVLVIEDWNECDQDADETDLFGIAGDASFAIEN